jgi:hypothetical protein
MLVLAAVAAWHIVLFPSNSNRQVDLPNTYTAELDCQNDMDNQVQSYVKTNGGDARRTRAACRSQ